MGYSPRSVYFLTLTALFAGLTALGAFLRIPTPWNAFSLQVLFVCLSGILLGPKYGALSQIIYVSLGLLGLPVFTGGGGLGYVLHPTFGFLLSYIPASFVIGLLAGKAPTSKRMAVACFAGLGTIYLIGLPYMGMILTVYLDRQFDLWSLLWIGMIPFLPGDFLKILLAIFLAKKLQPILPQAS